MAKDNRNTLTPKLRFPQFRNHPMWDTKLGGELFDQTNIRGASAGLPILAITQEHGAIPRDEIDYHVSVTDKSIETYKEVLPGDFIISLRSFQGGIEYSKYHGICSPAYVVLRRKAEISDAFYKYLFKSHGFIQQLTKNLEGIRDGKMISYKQFSELLLPYPSSSEQQKIAECLSTLDELIEAESRKLDALKDHKKGLMQHLFPREGETRPRLRFPEFRSSPDWTTRRMNEIYAFLANNSFSRDRLNYVSGSIKNIHYGDIHKHYRLLFDVTREVVPYINDDALASESQPVFCAEGDMVFADASEDLEDIGKCIEIVNLNNERVVAGLHTILARPKTRSAFARGFSGYLFSSKRIRAQIQKESQGTKVLGISAKRLANIELCFPVHVAEQERIADCLSSLDDLIAAQSERLEALRAHKRGLMQQLFPNPSEFES